MENPQGGQGIFSDHALERLVHNAENAHEVRVLWLGEELSEDPDVVESPLGVGDTHDPVEQVRSPTLNLSGMV